jgi:hypothetical protein
MTLTPCAFCIFHYSCVFLYGLFFQILPSVMSHAVLGMSMTSHNVRMSTMRKPRTWKKHRSTVNLMSLWPCGACAAVDAVFLLIGKRNGKKLPMYSIATTMDSLTCKTKSVCPYYANNRKQIVIVL